MSTSAEAQKKRKIEKNRMKRKVGESVVGLSGRNIFRKPLIRNLASRILSKLEVIQITKEIQSNLNISGKAKNESPRNNHGII